MLNRDDLARRVAHRGGYGVGDMKDVLEALEEVIVEAVNQGEDIKFGQLLKILIKDVPEKEAYNGLSKVYFTRPAKRVPKVKLLSQLANIELPPREEGN
jgi:nucleoid DNA-binding protein